MASLNQIKNMTWYLGGAKSKRAALIKSLHHLDQDIAQVEYDINEAWASRLEHPTEQEKDSGDKYDEYDCPLRKRKTKKIGKGIFTLSDLAIRDKKRTKEARSRKRTKRSRTQLKGERDYGVNDAIAENTLEYEEEEYQQPAAKDDAHAEALRLKDVELEQHRRALAAKDVNKETREMERQKRERDIIQEDGETEYRKMKRLKSEREIERWKREIERLSERESESERDCVRNMADVASS